MKLLRVDRFIGFAPSINVATQSDIVLDQLKGGRSALETEKQTGIKIRSSYPVFPMKRPWIFMTASGSNNITSKACDDPNRIFEQGNGSISPNPELMAAGTPTAICASGHSPVSKLDFSAHLPAG